MKLDNNFYESKSSTFKINLTRKFESSKKFVNVTILSIIDVYLLRGVVDFLNEDLSIIKKVLQGDLDAFASLMDRHHAYVIKIVRRMVPISEVEEVTQQTFISAFKNLKSYKGKTPFHHWLGKISYSRCNDFWRKFKREEKRISKLQSAIEISNSLDKSSDTNYSKIEDILNLLCPADRLVLTCIYIDDFTVDMTAALLGWSRSNVKIRSFRAKRKLKDILRTKQWGEGDE